MEFGKRLNVSGIAGLLLIPMIFVLGVLPLLATMVGYVTQSFLVQYALLAMFGLLSLAFYLVVVRFQGRSLEKRELEILEAVKEPTD